MFSEGEPPVLMKPLEDLTAISPNKILLECHITSGKPKASIKWFKDNKEVYSSNKYLMSYEDSVACLSIAPTEMKDAGRYRCEAANKLGRVETEAAMTVHCKFVNISIGFFHQIGSNYMDNFYNKCFCFQDFISGKCLMFLSSSNSYVINSNNCFYLIFIRISC